MSQIILVAHGNLAVEMKKSAEMIYGVIQNMQPISFTVDQGFDSIREHIKQVVDCYAGDTLILTDMFAGTPYNASCQICMQEPNKHIEVVSGMSLPIVLELANASTYQSAQEMVALIKTLSSQVIRSFHDQQMMEEEDF